MILVRSKCERRQDNKRSEAVRSGTKPYKAKRYEAKRYEAVQSEAVPSEAVRSRTKRSGTKRSGTFCRLCTALYRFGSINILAIKLELKYLNFKIFSLNYEFEQLPGSDHHGLGVQ